MKTYIIIPILSYSLLASCSSNESNTSSNTELTAHELPSMAKLYDSNASNNSASSTNLQALATNSTSDYDKHTANTITPGVLSGIEGLQPLAYIYCFYTSIKDQLELNASRYQLIDSKLIFNNTRTACLEEFGINAYYVFSSSSTFEYHAKLTRADNNSATILSLYAINTETYHKTEIKFTIEQEQSDALPYGKWRIDLESENLAEYGYNDGKAYLAVTTDADNNTLIHLYGWDGLGSKSEGENLVKARATVINKAALLISGEEEKIAKATDIIDGMTLDVLNTATDTLMHKVIDGLSFYLGEWYGYDYSSNSDAFQAADNSCSTESAQPNIYITNYVLFNEDGSYVKPSVVAKETIDITIEGTIYFWYAFADDTYKLDIVDSTYKGVSNSGAEHELLNNLVNEKTIITDGTNSYYVKADYYVDQFEAQKTANNEDNLLPCTDNGLSLDNMPELPTVNGWQAPDLDPLN